MGRWSSRTKESFSPAKPLGSPHKCFTVAVLIIKGEKILYSLCGKSRIGLKLNPNLLMFNHKVARISRHWEILLFLYFKNSNILQTLFKMYKGWSCKKWEQKNCECVYMYCVCVCVLIYVCMRVCVQWSTLKGFPITRVCWQGISAPHLTPFIICATHNSQSKIYRLCLCQTGRVVSISISSSGGDEIILYDVTMKHHRDKNTEKSSGEANLIKTLQLGKAYRSGSSCNTVDVCKYLFILDTLKWETAVTGHRSLHLCCIAALKPLQPIHKCSFIDLDLWYDLSGICIQCSKIILCYTLLAQCFTTIIAAFKLWQTLQ